MSESKKTNQTSKGIEEMERHLHHIDQEIVDLNKKTEGTLKKRDEEIQKATQENADLIKEVSQFREEKVNIMLEYKNVQKIADNLKRQLVQIKNTISSSTSKRQLGFDNKNVNNASSSGNENPLGGFNAVSRSSSQPILKGKISRGVNYDSGSLSIFTKAKIKDL